MAKGRVDLAGLRARETLDLPRGSFRLTGGYTSAGYNPRFVISNTLETGVTGFTGTMTGKRIGNCPG